MQTLQQLITDRVAAAIRQMENIPADFLPSVDPAADERFGDYQTNAAMILAKTLKTNPRQLAQKLVESIDVSGLSEKPEIAGPGFINFRVTTEQVSTRLIELVADPRLGVPELEKKEKIVIDFSSPNVAKPMHVGHIRTTVLGDTLAKVARFLGHTVITVNHYGDWGTQFGMIIYGWKNLLDRDALAENAIEELVGVYKRVNERQKNDEAVRDACRQELVKLQQGDAENRAIWEETVALSWKEFDRIYRILGIEFDHKLGESFYNPALAPLVERLQKEGIAEKSEGAVCIFFREDPALADKPCLIQKRDGGFLYGTTDLAAVEYRVREWSPTQIWYVVGAPQKLHLEQVFAAARKMGHTVKLEHVSFGSILGEDRKLMKTRSGDNVPFLGVLEEAERRVQAIIEEKNALEESERAAIAHAIGIGAVKYAELSQHRMTDYVFSWDKMLSFQGNTAPYLQNAYVRIKGIFRKLEGTYAATPTVVLSDAEEIQLAKKVGQFGEVIPAVLNDFRPNMIANYLYELAGRFHSFFEACPVLKSEGVVRESRLLLCDATARVLKQGLALLGIEAPERM